MLMEKDQLFFNLAMLDSEADLMHLKNAETVTHHETVPLQLVGIESGHQEIITFNLISSP